MFVMDAVRVSDRARACCTAPSPAPVFGVISELFKNFVMLV